MQAIVIVVIVSPIELQTIHRFSKARRRPFVTFALASQFHVYLPWVNTQFSQCLNSVLNVKALVGPQKGMFVKTDGSFAALHRTLHWPLDTRHTRDVDRVTFSQVDQYLYLLSETQHTARFLRTRLPCSLSSHHHQTRDTRGTTRRTRAWIFFTDGCI